MALDLVKEIAEVKKYAEGAEAIVKNLVDTWKVSEPARSGYLKTVEDLLLHINTIEKELTKKPESIPTGVAKIDVKTGIKKVFTP